MVCFDTDFLIDFSRKRPEAIEKMEQFCSSGEELCITPVTATELFVGVFMAGKPAEMEKIEELLFSFKLLEYDLAASRITGRILFELRKKGAIIGDMDSTTAAIAIRHNQVLITRNKKHFSRISSLKIESW